MGTDLYSISNHTIGYGDFDFDRLGREVAARLNQTRLENPEFYWLSRVYWENGARHSASQNPQRLLVPWTLNDTPEQRAEFSDQDDDSRGLLNFSGPFEWEINLRPGSAELHLMPFRYGQWTRPAPTDSAGEFRDAYRKALALLVRSLGGSEALYLADNGHPLERFWQTQNYTALREELAREFGPPLPDFTAMAHWQAQRTGMDQTDTAYLVDDFSDLDWTQPLRLPVHLQELRDRSSLTLPDNWPDAP